MSRVLRTKTSRPKNGQIIICSGEEPLPLCSDGKKVRNVFRANVQGQNTNIPSFWRLSFRRALEVQHHEPLLPLGCIEEDEIPAFSRLSSLTLGGPEVLQNALDENHDEDVRDLVENSFEFVAKGAFSWLAELNSLGHSRSELSKALMEKSRDSPWIFFEQLEPSTTVINTNHHIPGCVHQGASGLGVQTAYIPEASSFSESAAVINDSQLLIHRVPHGVQGATFNLHEFRKTEKTTSNNVQQERKTKEHPKSIVKRSLHALRKKVSPTRALPRVSRQKAHAYETPRAGRPERISILLSELPIERHGNVMNHLVAAKCGIGGITPTSRDKSSWVGNVTFERSKDEASVSYSLEQGRECPSDTSDVFLLISRIRRALESFCDAVSILQDADLCCNSFTVIAQVLNKSEVELLPLEFESAVLLWKTIQKLQTAESTPYPLLEDCTKASLVILRQICGVEAINESVIPLWLGKNWEQDRMLHVCSLATQALCLGLLSYSSAHTGALQHFFLDTALREVCMKGSMSGQSAPRIKLRLERLTCMGRMVHDFGPSSRWWTTWHPLNRKWTSSALQTIFWIRGAQDIPSTARQTSNLVGTGTTGRLLFE